MDDCWESPSGTADSIESSLGSKQNPGFFREKAITNQKHSLCKSPTLALSSKFNTENIRRQI